MNHQVDEPRLKILVFEIGGQRYGVAAACVQEVLRMMAVVALPKAPAVVEGIVNLRGRVIPVLDMRGRFRLPAKPVELSDHLLVAHAGPRLVGLRVDRALDLVDLDANELEEGRAVVPGVEYVAWVAKQPHHLVIIHDLETFLTRSEAAALDEALPAFPSSDPGN